MEAGRIETAPLLADKWRPVDRFVNSIPNTIEKRRTMLGNKMIELSQIHHPVSFSFIEGQMRAKAELVEKTNKSDWC